MHARTQLRRTLPATLNAVEEFCAEFRGICSSLPQRSHRFAAELLLREAMTNAVVHGCRSDPSRRLVCAVRLKPRRLIIAVQDDGDGFDWRAALGRQAGTCSCSGRGLEILRNYATRIRFNRSGNTTTIFKQF
jgi:anti-sigma regulatory factor (Ser/Thr protein kinase)